MNNYVDTKDMFIMNPHWDDETYSFPFERDLLSTLKGQLSHRLIVALTGIRRVGKTTLLKQLMSHLLAENVPSKNIFYFSFDNTKADIKDILIEWERISNIDLRKDINYVFLDEIQKIDNWGSKLKIIYDNFPQMKIFISGSASSQIKKGQESLAGRILEFPVKPLSFKEYLNFTDKTTDFLPALWKHYNSYMLSQLPELVNSSIDVKSYITSIVHKVIFEDAVIHYNILEPEMLESLFRIICKHPGQIMDYRDVSKDLGIDRATVSKYFKILEESYLVRKMYNFSGNARKSEVKAKRFYPAFTTLCAYTFPYSAELPYMGETEVQWQTNAEFFYNEKGKEIDFITGDELNIAIEVKLRKYIDKSDLRTILNASEEKFKKKVIVTLPETEVRIKEKEKLPIEFIPLHKLSADFQTI